MDLFSIIAGHQDALVVTLANSSGAPVTTYTNSDVPSSVVWPGEDQATTFAPTTTWVSAAAGTIQVAISAAMTSGVAPGRYLLSVQIRPGGTGDPVEGYRCWLEILAKSGGTTATLPTYCSYSDLLYFAPWISKLQDPTDEAGFLRHRNLARQHLDYVIQRHYQGTGYQGLSSIGYVVSFAPVWTSGAPSPWLQEQLDNDKLMRNSQTIEITAKWALSYICASAISPSDKDSTYQLLAARYQSEADSLVSGWTAGIDLNGDDFAEVQVNCGITSIRN